VRRRLCINTGVFARSLWRPRMGPAPVPRATCPGHGGGGRRRGAPPWLPQGGGGAPGRRPHSRSRARHAGHGRWWRGKASWTTVLPRERGPENGGTAAALPPRCRPT